MGELKTLDMLPRQEVETAAAASQVHAGPVEDENERAVLLEPVTAEMLRFICHPSILNPGLRHHHEIYLL